ncbi:hypothetical protein [Micromonospora sp. WMMD1082]|uniref:hypothetical protein n=1 Tax=Micromonospora sp. WMMD1082 TaxID=3016104 RepID=UPI002415E21B|nr:hypothetical protein [Micromonospora sp. WMMD1082]MDG4795998.1 hypothetical protein [Micromonospora sp. WMMD1082]
MADVIPRKDELQAKIELEKIARRGISQSQLLECVALLDLTAHLADRWQVPPTDALSRVLHALVAYRRENPAPERGGFDYVDVFGEFAGIRDERYPEDPKPAKGRYGETEVRQARAGRKITSRGSGRGGISSPRNAREHIDKSIPPAYKVFAWITVQPELIESMMDIAPAVQLPPTEKVDSQDSEFVDGDRGTPEVVSEEPDIPRQPLNRPAISEEVVDKSEPGALGNFRLKRMALMQRLTRRRLVAGVSLVVLAIAALVYVVAVRDGRPSQERLYLTVEKSTHPDLKLTHTERGTTVEADISQQEISPSRYFDVTLRSTQGPINIIEAEVIFLPEAGCDHYLHWRIFLGDLILTEGVLHGSNLRAGISEKLLPPLESFQFVAWLQADLKHDFLSPVCTKGRAAIEIAPMYTSTR